MGRKRPFVVRLSDDFITKIHTMTDRVMKALPKKRITSSTVVREALALGLGAMEQRYPVEPPEEEPAENLSTVAKV